MGGKEQKVININRAFNGKKRNNYRTCIENYRYNRDIKTNKSTVLGELTGEAFMYFGECEHDHGNLKYQIPSFATLNIREASNRGEEELKQDEISEISDCYFRSCPMHYKFKGS